VATLEARFHPRSKAGGGFVVIGRIVCNGRRASIQPGEIAAPAVKPFDSGGLLRKLHFLVESAVPDPFHELLRLRSDYWSFVELET
jgi:hypothetical protein